MRMLFKAARSSNSLDASNVITDRSGLRAGSSLPPPPPAAALVTEQGIPQLVGQLRQVGTFDPSQPFEVIGKGPNLGKQALGALGFNPPSLLGVFALGPYLHNGTVVDLEGILDNPAHVGDSHLLSSPGHRRDLVRFLKSIDDSTPPFP